MAVNDPSESHDSENSKPPASPVPTPEPGGVGSPRRKTSKGRGATRLPDGHATDRGWAKWITWTLDNCQKTMALLPALLTGAVAIGTLLGGLTCAAIKPVPAPTPAAVPTPSPELMVGMSDDPNAVIALNGQPSIVNGLYQVAAVLHPNQTFQDQLTFASVGYNGPSRSGYGGASLIVTLPTGPSKGYDLWTGGSVEVPYHGDNYRILVTGVDREKNQCGIKFFKLPPETPPPPKS